MKDIIKKLDELTFSDLILLHTKIAYKLYTKGLEDYVRGLEIGRSLNEREIKLYTKHLKEDLD